MNTGILLKNYKKYVRGNWSQSKDGTDIFETDKNASAKRNDKIIIDFNYGSDNVWKTTYLTVLSLGCTWILRFDCSFQFLVLFPKISNL